MSESQIVHRPYVEMSESNREAMRLHREAMDLLNTHRKKMVEIETQQEEDDFLILLIL